MIMLASVFAVALHAQKPGVNTYFVMAPHNPDQCMKALNEMKGKGESFVSKFYFGCMSGDHTSYAFLQGTSEENVRKMLPKEYQENAKIMKVDKFTVAQIEKMHKDQSKK